MICRSYCDRKIAKPCLSGFCAKIARYCRHCLFISKMRTMPAKHKNVIISKSDFFRRSVYSLSNLGSLKQRYICDMSTKHKKGEVNKTEHFPFYQRATLIINVIQIPQQLAKNCSGLILKDFQRRNLSKSPQWKFVKSAAAGPIAASSSLFQMRQ